jgi:preprotein translocase subunit SecF
MPYEDIVNISMNQVIMRSLLTSLSSILPVISLLLIGSGVLGVVSLQEFALALLVGMVSGVLSSIFIATPLLAWLKRDTGRKSYRKRLLGDELRAAVIGAGVTGRVGEGESSDATPGSNSAAGGPAAAAADADADADAVLVGSRVAQPADRLLSHPPRPRKKKRR